MGRTICCEVLESAGTCGLASLVDYFVFHVIGADLLLGD